jgi:hypothetical protein
MQVIKAVILKMIANAAQTNNNKIMQKKRSALGHISRASI